MHPNKINMQKTGWTPERRQRQAELIQRWRPWEQSTGPKTPEGKAVVAQNPYKGGHRQKWRELAKQLNVELAAMRQVRLACTDPWMGFS